MDIASAHTLYTALAGDEVSFIYSGDFHDEHTARLISLCEAHLEAKSAPRPMRQRLAFVVVEAYQNIIRHRAATTGELEHGKGRSMLVLRCRPEAQQVCAVNAMRKQDVPDLQQVLDRLRGLDRGQLKDLFLDRLRSHGHGNRGGAGLGLIEMARRSGHDLLHQLLPLDDEHDLFMLQVTLGQDTANEADGMEPVGTLHRAVAEHDILLLHQGATTGAVQEALLRIIEKDLDHKPERADARTRAYLAAMEFLSEETTLQGHAMLVLARRQKRYVLTLAGVLDPGAAPVLAQQVNELTRMQSTELQQWYRKALLLRAQGSAPVGMGLIDLAMHAQEPLVHDRMESQGMDFFMAQAVV